MKHLLVVWIAFFMTLAYGQTSQSLQNLEQQQQLTDAMATLNQADAQIEKIIKTRELDCKKAFGYAPFCECVLNDLPIAWSFSDYVAITTCSREENGFSKMAKDLQSAYSKVAPIRDRCVVQINRR